MCIVGVSRELLRLWVRNEDLAWNLPKELVAHWRLLFHTAEPGTQEFFPDEERRVQDGDNDSHTGETWKYAGNEGGIPDTQL